MPVNLSLDPAQPVAGVQLSPIAAGIKSNGAYDMLLVLLEEGSTVAGVFTKNVFAAAPVTVAKTHLSETRGKVRALLVNSGNANAGTGQPGIDMAQSHCAAVAEHLGLDANQVLPFSTGVIGQLLPQETMLSGIESASKALGANWQAAAESIMTTDTEPKITSVQRTVNGETITVTGFAKGAGMIQPNMATMLAYLFTDANVTSDDLQRALEEAVAKSFNAITVDSDTSTNDACILSATGKGVAVGVFDTDWPLFVEAVAEVALPLAQAIVRDAEGATKFITVNVSAGRDTQQCKAVAYAIANSPLVKTAMFASDANVGRLLMAIGKAETDGLDANTIRVSLDDVPAFEKGGIAAGYTEEQGAAVMAKAEITVNVELGQGDAQASVYTSDLSHDYVSINADYRS